MLVFTGYIFSACGTTTSTIQSELQLEQYSLLSAPELVPLTFQTQDMTQNEILAKRENERQKITSNPVQSIDGLPTIFSLGSGKDMAAVVRTSTEAPLHQVVDLIEDEEIIFSVDAGLPSPAIPLQGLWSYENHWVLEIVYSDPNTWKGMIYQDGELINDKFDYDEAFGFQLLSSKPFYFFQRDGNVGYSYNGHEVTLPYQQIPHYHCCAETERNPIHAETLVSFFAVQDDNWFFVDLGLFED